MHDSDQVTKMNKTRMSKEEKGEDSSHRGSKTNQQVANCNGEEKDSTTALLREPGQLIFSCNLCGFHFPQLKNSTSMDSFYELSIK